MNPMPKERKNVESTDATIYPPVVKLTNAGKTSLTVYILILQKRDKVAKKQKVKVKKMTIATVSPLTTHAGMNVTEKKMIATVTMMMAHAGKHVSKTCESIDEFIDF